MIELRAHDWEGFLYMTNLLSEAGVSWDPVGANTARVDEVEVVDRLSAELHAEISGVAAGLPPAPELTEPDGVGDDLGGPPTSGPEAESTPATPPGAGVGELPPRAGPAATRAAWAAAAESLGLPVEETDSRDDLIRKVDARDAR